MDSPLKLGYYDIRIGVRPPVQVDDAMLFMKR